MSLCSLYFQGKLINGMYYPMAVEWLSVFPRKQIKFINSVDWYYNSTKVAAEIFEFLGMSMYFYTGRNVNKIQAHKVILYINIHTCIYIF